MKTVLFSALALSAVAMSSSAMASDGSNWDTYNSLYQSKQMQMDGRNAMAISEGQKSVRDFLNFHDKKYGYSAQLNLRDAEGTNR